MCLKLSKNSDSHQGNPAVSCDAFPGPDYQEIATEVHELCLYTPRRRVCVIIRAGHVQSCWATHQGLASLMHEVISFGQRHMTTSFTFSVTTRSNASSLDIFAAICFLRCSHHAEDAKRCNMTTLQSARKEDGSTVGSKIKFEMIRAV
jgi:hypothetical protein